MYRRKAEKRKWEMIFTDGQMVYIDYIELMCGRLGRGGGSPTKQLKTEF